ncbi:hypothetical protein L9F63_008128, partial [Diploptera punctata]
ITMDGLFSGSEVEEMPFFYFISEDEAQHNINTFLVIVLTTFFATLPYFDFIYTICTIQESVRFN